MPERVEAADTLIHRRVADGRAGDNPKAVATKAVARVRSGWVVLGDVQFLTGYSLVLPDPVVADLNGSTGSRAERSSTTWS
jgi:hypothetical protein